MNDLFSPIANKTPIEHIENTLKINGNFFFWVANGGYYIIKWSKMFMSKNCQVQSFDHKNGITGNFFLISVICKGVFNR